MTRAATAKQPARRSAGLENDDSPANPEAAQALRQFRQVFNAVRTHFQQVEKQVGLGGAQVWALSVVRDQPGIGVGGLARAMDIHQSTASNLVKLLIEREMIAATKQGSDRRAVQLQLLPAGKRVLKRSPGPFSGVLPNALQTLDRATLRRLNRDLDKLIAALNPTQDAAQTLLADL